MNRWRVGEDRGSKEKDRCSLTTVCKRIPSGYDGNRTCFAKLSGTSLGAHSLILVEQ
jgi:hypothetical protein